MNDSANVVLVSGIEAQSLQAACSRLAADVPVELVDSSELLNRLRGSSRPCVVVVDAATAADLPTERTDGGWPIILVALGEHEPEPTLGPGSVHGYVRMTFGTDEVVRLLNACVRARIRLAGDAMSSAFAALSGGTLFMLLG